MMNSIKRQNLYELAALFGASLFFFTWNLSSEEIIGFESRFYYFAMEMLRDGVSWFPTTYHKPYPDYPAMGTWLIYLFAKLFGGLNKFVANLPCAIAAAVSVVVTYLIGALHSKRWGLCAVLLLFLTVSFLKDARSMVLDIYPTMVTTCCFYIVYSADVLSKPRRTAWLYVFLLVGFAFRGPIGLIMPTGVVCSYYLLNKAFKKLILSGLFAFLLLLICMAILLALAYHVGGFDFMQDVLRMQVLGRIDNKYLPFYFYFVASIKDYALSFPLACLVFYGIFYYRTKQSKTSVEVKLLFYLFGWIIVILLGMSIPGDKKIRYVLPMVPAIALVAAYLFVAPEQHRFFASLRQILTKIFLFFPAFFLLATEAVFYYAKNQSLSFHIYYLPLALFLIAMQLLSFWVVYRDILKPSSVEIKILFLAALSFVVTYICLIEPIKLYVERARDFVMAVEQQRKEKRAILIFYKEKPDGLAIKYLINTSLTDDPRFIDNPEDLEKVSQPAFFVTSEAYFVKLPDTIKEQFKIVANDRVGHVRIVVFTNQ